MSTYLLIICYCQDHYWDGEELSGHGKAYKSISLGEEMKLNIM